ncbi:AAA-domain-containing protein [Ramaria rubella]|nr:AAA-domain-containing protein [Ramaria rubella]
MSSSSGSKRLVLDVYFSVALFLASQAALFYTVSWALEALGTDHEKKKAKAKSNEVMRRLGREKLQLNEHEQIIAAEVIHPDDIDIKFSDIGGLDPIISSLRESVIYPLVYPTLFTTSSSLLSAPKGVLLYGPPGCGKTMLAKALAKESGATFINIAVSVISNKWYGESNKLVAGLFGLARKMQPSIIFIDEIDSFLRERGRGDHEVTAMMKAEFMTLWDGLLSGADRIMVLGATNRPNDIDSAILRRMPKRFAVPLPDASQRRKILELTLEGTQLVPGFPIDVLAQRTANYSGSDLKEVCRNAAMAPVREYMRENGDNQAALERGRTEGYSLRPLTMDDFFVADCATTTLEPFIIQAQDRSRLDDDD